jgi:uncharacterized protein
MGAQSLAALHKLQEVETKLRGLKAQISRKARQLKHHRLRVTQTEDQLNDRQEEIKNRKMKAAQLELDFQTKNADIDKLRTQLNVTKNNKEYSLILTQLNTQRADNTKLEENVLEELTAIEGLQSSLTEIEKVLANQQETLAAAEQEVAAYQQELQNEIDDLNAQREAVTEEISPDELLIFERVADAHDGEVLAKVIKPGKDQEFICGGCNMSLPMEKINSLLTKEQVQVCNICGCILYIESTHELK